MNLHKSASAILAVLLLNVAVFSEDLELEEAFGGFEESSELYISIDPADSYSTHTDWLSGYGSIGFSTSYNYAHKAPESKKTDFRGVSRMRTKADLVFDMKFSQNWRGKVEMKAFYDLLYSLRDDNYYSDDVLKTYESEAEFKEVYLQGSFGENIDIKIGRQTVVWGKSDNIRITDVINPMDNREQGMVDIEDLRLPVVMTKVDYYINSWNISAMAIHESRVQKEAAVGSDFLPTHLFSLPNGSFPKEVLPKSNLENTQFAYALNRSFSGWDLSIYKADILDSRWHIKGDMFSGATREYSKVDMLGFATNIVAGSWLFKFEEAWFDKLKYNNITGDKKRRDSLLGMEYMGIKETTISLEIANRHIFDYESKMKDMPNFVYEDEQQIAVRISYSFDHDRGLATFLVSEFFAKGDLLGGFSRFWIEYDIADALSVSTGVVDYIGGEKLILDAFKDNDRVFADITYSFGI